MNITCIYITRISLVYILPGYHFTLDKCYSDILNLCISYSDIIVLGMYYLLYSLLFIVNTHTHSALLYCYRIYLFELPPEFTAQNTTRIRYTNYCIKNTTKSATTSTTKNITKNTTKSATNKYHKKYHKKIPQRNTT